MSGDATGSMELVGRRDGDEATAGTLVLLYAPSFLEIPPAFSADPLVLGREPPPGGLVVNDAAMSRVHARVSSKDGRWVIADLDSRNGTLVNGMFVEGEQALEHNDEIRTGNALFKLVLEPPGDFRRFRIDGSVLEGPVSPLADRLVGGAQMERIRGEIERIAPAALSVLVLGETGTGKEVVASLLHDASHRRGTLGAVNCAAIPAALLESELFGHKRGAFTGADRDRVGHVRAAHGGTLFLDEIGDMPLEAQAKMLRLLETREVTPLGSTTPERVDVRLVCATHRDLPALVARGAFRADLHARIRGHTVRLPPLRDRKEDVFLLVRTFLGRARPDLTVSTSFMLAALEYDWPYNVRELATAITRAAALADRPVLDHAHLPDEVRECLRPADRPRTGKAPSALREREAPSAEALVKLLVDNEGSVAAVARALGRDRVQIRRWLRKYGISRDDYQA